MQFGQLLKHLHDGNFQERLLEITEQVATISSSTTHLPAQTSARVEVFSSSIKSPF